MKLYINNGRWLIKFNCNWKSKYNFNEKINFAHDKVYKLPNNILLVGCYHPSPRNVNTGRINEKKMTSLFKKVARLT